MSGLISDIFWYITSIIGKYANIKDGPEHLCKWRSIQVNGSNIIEWKGWAIYRYITKYWSNIATMVLRYLKKWYFIKTTNSVYLWHCQWRMWSWQNQAGGFKGKEFFTQSGGWLKFWLYIFFKVVNMNEWLASFTICSTRFLICNFRIISLY